MGVLTSGGDAPGMNAAISEAFMTPEGRKIAYDNMKAAGIDALIIIGGNGSLAGAQIFAKEYDVPCIGLPGIIDNDLYGTDYTIGYDTALNTIVEGVEIRHKLTKKGLVLLYRRVILSRSRPIGRWIQPVCQNGGQSSRPIRQKGGNARIQWK